MATSWRIGAPYGADKVEVVTTDGGQAVAIVWVKRGVPDRETGREVFVDDLAGIGRARLIAAAPDMAAALTEAKKALSYAMRGTSDAEQSDKYAATIARIDAALGKAGA